MHKHGFLLLSFLLCLGLWLGTLSSALADAPAPWDANAQGHFITSLCRDAQNRLWVGTEDGQGLWVYDPASKSWTHFPASADLSGDIYALACDKAGRIWAGGLSGVSVYNGKEWRQYGLTDGPLGTRLFALAVSPKDGGVWGATEAGLFRYAQSHWTYFTRADGLPSDQAQALAFAPDGTLYVGTQCDGVAVGSPADGYKTWRVTSGLAHLPNAATGSGLPSGLINALLVASDGTVYAGTDCGLAQSSDAGLTWHFSRGVNWKDKLAGLYHPITPDTRPIPGDLLREDYVTCLGEDGAGRIWIGHRQGGVEAFDPKTGHRVQSGANASTPSDYISALLLTKKSSWVGLYGGGLLPPDTAEPLAACPPPASVPPLPIPAAPPTLAELNTMLARVKSLKGEMPVGGGAFLGQDWRTLGDWIGHYGRQYAVLCAVASPMDQILTWGQGYAVDGSLGPHIQGGDKLRHWIQPGMVNTSRLGTLYSPVDGFRTQAEWDDHGETYPHTFEGPDVWVTVTVPAGIHRISLYETNKDGHDGDNRIRDYAVDLLPYRAKIEDAMLLPPLAHARIHDFWNGCYTSFVVRGPAQYYVHVAKNNSLNTLVAGVFLDKIGGPKARGDNDIMPAMYEVRYDPPDPDAPPLTSNVPLPPPPVLTPAQTATLRAARLLWDSLDAAQADSVSAPWQTSYRVLAYRAATASQASPHLQENWRWHLRLWTEGDRLWFDRNVALVASMKNVPPPTH